MHIAKPVNEIYKFIYTYIYISFHKYLNKI